MTSFEMIPSDKLGMLEYCQAIGWRSQCERRTEHKKTMEAVRTNNTALYLLCDCTPFAAPL